MEWQRELAGSPGDGRRCTIINNGLSRTDYGKMGGGEGSSFGLTLFKIGWGIFTVVNTLFTCKVYIKGFLCEPAEVYASMGRGFG